MQNTPLVCYSYKYQISFWFSKIIVFLLFFLLSIPHQIYANTQDSLLLLAAQYEDKELSSKDSIQLADYWWDYIYATKDADLESAKLYAQKMYDLAANSNNPEILVKVYDTKIELADRSTPRSEIRKYYKEVIRNYEYQLIENRSDSILVHNKVYYSRLLGGEYQEIYKYDSAQIILLEALEDAKRFNIITELASCNNTLGIVNDLQGEYDKAEENYNNAINYAEILKDSIRVMRYTMNRGSLLSVLGKIKESTSSYLKALNYAEALDQVGTQAKNHLNLSFNYSDLENYQKSLDHLELAKDKYLEVNDKIGMMYYYEAKASIYKEQKNYIEALKLTDTLLKEAAIEKDNYFLILGKLLKGDISISMKEYDKAKQILIEALEMASTYEINLEVYNAKLNLGSIYIQEKNYSSALKILNEVNDEEEYLSLNQKQNLKKLLSKSYANLGDYDKAYDLVLVAHKLQDSILNTENVRKITTLELNNQFENEKAILALEQEKEEALLTAQAERTRIIAGAIGLLAFLGFVFFLNANRRNKIITKQNEALQNLNKLKDKIFAVLGHDLRKPALAFRGLSKKIAYLIDNQDFKTLNKVGKSLEKDANALNNLTDNILNWALVQKEHSLFKSTSLELKEMISQVTEIFEHTLSQKEINLEKDILDNTLVYTNPNACTTIIRNLLDNAIKFTPKGGHIKIQSKEVNEDIMIQIEDSGIGISEEKIKTIFHLDKEKSTAGTEGEKGTGLGLHIVKQLVEQTNGRIEVNSKLGKGTIFTLYFPKAS